MRLADLATALGAPLPEGADPETGVTGVTHQADWVRAGDLFVAVRGARFDGHDFITRALGAGAVAVAGEGLPEGADCPVPYLTVPAARAALADAAAELAGHPSRQLTVLGVTGTDGKTTTSCLLRHLLRAAGTPTGLLSTIGYELPDGVLRQPPAHFTTPEAPQVQQILQEMVHAGARAVVVETSSHALALDRVRGVDYDIAVWTNLTGEHLDFHGSMEGYFADKAKLVERAREAVLNLDDAWTPRLLDVAGQVTTYRAEPARAPVGGEAATGAGEEHPSPVDADWWVTDVTEGPDDLRFTVHSPQGEAAAVLPMIGRFNVHNALAALAAAHRAGVSLEQLLTGLATFAGVPGRMEMVDREAGDPRVIVDFAHTAPSLEKALATVRVTTEGQLWVVLGSAGGPRDPSKRAPLGEVASRMADRVVFTEEDHRDTPLQDILEEMERGASRTGRGNYTSIGNRVEAIRYAVAEAAPEDTVVLAGKGPEETLERDTETIPWNELQQALDALAARREAQANT